MELVLSAQFPVLAPTEGLGALWAPNHCADANGITNFTADNLIVRTFLSNENEANNRVIFTKWLREGCTVLTDQWRDWSVACCTQINKAYIEVACWSVILQIVVECSECKNSIEYVVNKKRSHHSERPMPPPPQLRCFLFQ